MDFHVLGQVEAYQNGRPVPLGRRRERFLLAVLLLEVGRTVPAERLVSLLWDDDPPRNARRNLHVHVSRLRATLDPHGDGRYGLRLRTRDGGYLADVDPLRVDAYRFRDLVAQARGCPLPAERAAALRTALRLWRGPALSGVTTEVVRRRLVAGLEELRFSALESRLEAELEAGRHREVIPELTDLVETHPLRESLAADLMLALYRAGRQADALATYQQMRARLASELGLDPGARLTSQHEAILRAGPALDPVGLSADPCPRPAQLPADVADFSGRGPEVRQIVDGFVTGAGRAVVVWAVSGRAGVGKSTLMVHVGHRLASRFGDGQLYVDLCGTSENPIEPGEALGSFLRALGMSERGIPASTHERAAMYRSMLADKRVLVLLDDAASESQVRDLLPGSAHCGVLIASRTRLTGIPGCWQLGLDGLEPAAAGELLARLVGTSRIAAEPQAAARLLEQCGRLPLALRIVGARLAAHPHRPLAELACRMADGQRRLDELAYAHLDVRASLTLSYDGLTEPLRRLFRRLALLDAPDFAGWTAAAVLDEPPMVAEGLLDQLVEANLIDVVGTDAADQIRYRFHKLVRTYAQECAHRDEEPAARTECVARALAGWLVVATRAVAVGHATTYHSSLFKIAWRLESLSWRPADSVVAVATGRPIAWLDAERSAIKAGVRQADSADLTSICWRLAASGCALYSIRNHYDDWRDTNSRALAAAKRGNDHHAVAVMVAQRGLLQLDQRRYRSAAHLFEGAERRFRRLGHTQGVACAQCGQAWIAHATGELGAALRLYRKALAGFRRSGDRIGQLDMLTGIGKVCLTAGRPRDALVHLVSALRAGAGAIRDGVGQRTRREARARVLPLLAQAHVELGQFERAVALLNEALETSRQTDLPGGQGYALCGLGRAAVRGGQHDRAALLLIDALRIAQRTGDRTMEGHVRYALGELHHARGESAAATGALEQAATVWRAAGARTYLGRTLRLLAAVRNASGESSVTATGGPGNRDSLVGDCRSWSG